MKTRKCECGSYAVNKFKNVMKVNENDRIEFGKYKGKTFDEIADHDPDYLLWLHQNVKHIEFKKEFIEAVQMELDEKRDIVLENYFDIYY